MNSEGMPDSDAGFRGVETLRRSKVEAPPEISNEDLEPKYRAVSKAKCQLLSPLLSHRLPALKLATNQIQTTKNDPHLGAESEFDRDEKPVVWKSGLQQRRHLVAERCLAQFCWVPIEKLQRCTGHH